MPNSISYIDKEKILIVDDSSDMRSLLSEMLRDVGYTTIEAESGNKALNIASQEAIDIVLLDIVMPRMSGLDVMSEMKKIRPGARIIIITGYGSVKDAVNAMKKGASDYIKKPIEREEFLATVGRVIEEAKFIESIANDDEFDHVLTSLSNPLRRRILGFLNSRTNVRLTEITRELGIKDHTKVVFHLKTLRQSGIVLQNGKTYSLTEEGLKAVECLNLMLDNFFKNEFKRN